MPTTATRATWDEITQLLIDGYGARIRGRHGNERTWTVPVAVRNRETLTVEVILRPRWCSLAVDRWNTTDRDPDVARPWFEANIWPAVRAACRARGSSGVLPSGPTYASAHPIQRADVLDLLDRWLAEELTWCGTP